MIINQRDKKQIIDYKPEALREFEVMPYEWIDNLCFTIDPKECLQNPDEYLEIVKEKFLEHGWYGDGEIELMWIPPFMFEEISDSRFTKGKVVWHVKQLEDGISWILHEKDLFTNIKSID